MFSNEKYQVIIHTFLTKADDCKRNADAKLVFKVHTNIANNTGVLM